MVLMIICICRRINEKGVRKAVSAGARSPESVQSYHGCQFNCGKCRCAIGEVIADHLEATPSADLLVAAE